MIMKINNIVVIIGISALIVMLIIGSFGIGYKEGKDESEDYFANCFNYVYYLNFNPEEYETQSDLETRATASVILCQNILHGGIE